MHKRGTLLSMILFLAIAGINTLHAQKSSAELISSIGPSTMKSGQTVSDGIRNLTYYQNKIYVVNVWAGVQVVDVSDLRNPKEIGKFFNEHRGHNFFIEGKYGYFSDELEGVIITDISDPANIKKVGRVRTAGNAYWVEARFPYLFVAEEQKGVGVYDITDPASPQQVSSFDTPGWAWGLTLSGDLVYVADKMGGLQIIDFSQITAPKRIGQFTNAQNAKTVSVQDGYAYVTDGAQGVIIIDVSNPEFPSQVSSIDVDGFAFNAFRAGKFLYVANESRRTLDLVNISDPAHPVLESSYQSDSKVFAAWKQDVYVFVAADNKTLILRHNNTPELAAIGDQVVDEEMPLTFTARGSDPDGDPIVYSITNLPAGASFDTTGGTFAWTPDYEQSGVYKPIVVRVTERTESKLWAADTISITVNHVNRAPSLPDIADYSVEENKLLTFEIPNGDDPDKEDAGKLKYSAENLPDGAIFDGKTRSFSWTPTFEQSGIYLVDFIVSDPAGGVDRESSTITVSHIDRKPTIVAVENKGVAENDVLTFVVEGSDPDKEDQNAISFSAIGLPKGATFDPASRTFTWQPDYTQSGDYGDLSFVMQAGALSDTTVFAISVAHVNLQPKLEPVPDNTVDEQKTLTFSISGSDFDAEDSGKLKYTTGPLPEGAVFNPDSLTFTWTPTYDQSGNYTVTFSVTDPSGLVDSKTTTLTVNHVNRPPVLNEIADAMVDENLVLNFDVTGSDPDVEDQQKIAITVTGLPEGATFDGTTFNWTANYDQSGTYPLEFTISDGVLTDVKSTTITVNHVNRPPVIAEVAPQSVDENQPLNFTVAGDDPDTEDAAKWVLSTQNMPVGAAFDPATGTFSWTPTFEQSGLYTITIVNTDPAGLTVNREIGITVNHVNRTPEFAALPAQVIDENSPLSFTVPPATDPDKEDEGKLVYTATDLPEGAAFDGASRTLTWTPGFDQSGQYTITITAADAGFSVPQPLTITVNHVNRPPVIEPIAAVVTDENIPWQFKVKFSDPDKEDDGKLTIAAANLPQAAAFDAASGTFTWTPGYDQSGNYAGITVTVSDPAGASAEQSFDITVNHINRAPELTAVSAQTVAENAPLSISLSASDADAEDAGKLTWSASGLPSGASIDPASGTISWTPNFLQAGEYTITAKVTDSGDLSAEQQVAVNVTNVNRAPEFMPVSPQTFREGQSGSFSVSAGDADTDNTLSYSCSDLPSGASLDENSGTINWSPEFDQAGTYTLNFTVSDGEAEATTSVAVTVEDVNRAPSISGGGSVTVTTGGSVSESFSASDPDGDSLTFTASGLPSGATIDSGNGTVSWTPGENQAGSYSVTVTVSDGKADASASLSITVEAPVVAPPDTTK